MKLAALTLAAFALLSAPAMAKVPLEDNQHITDSLMAGRVADVIRSTCPSISARMVTAYSKLEDLKKYAVDQGYTEAEVKAFLKDKSQKDRIKALTGGQGADVIYDPVGGDFSEAAFRSIAWEGRFLVIGFAAGPIPKLPLNLVLLKGAQVVGVFWGSFTAREPERHQANIRELMQWYSAGKLKPRVDATYPFEKVAAALGGPHADARPAQRDGPIGLFNGMTPPVDEEPGIDRRAHFQFPSRKRAGAVIAEAQRDLAQIGLPRHLLKSRSMGELSVASHSR